MELKEELDYIERIKAGEIDLYSYFVTTYSASIYQLIYQIIYSQEVTEELVQDTFLKGFQSLHKYKGKGLFYTYLYRIAYNIAISHVRRKKQTVVWIDDELIKDVSEEKMSQLFDSSLNEKEDKISLLEKAIVLLSAEERALVLFYYYENKKIEEIASIIGVSNSLIKTRLFRIRKKLVVLYEKVKNEKR